MRLVAAVVASGFLGAACSAASFIDQVTILNDTQYSANVEVTGETRNGWLGLATVQPESTTTVEAVIDQGEVWIFRFDYVGKYEEEVEVTRAELERNDWTVEVPESFDQGLRDLNVPPPP